MGKTRAKTPYPLILSLQDGSFVEVGKAFTEGGEHINSISWSHAHLHDGEVYEACYLEEDVANDGTVELLVNVPSGVAKEPHMLFVVNCGGDAKVEVFEGSEPSGNGTEITPVNSRRSVDSNPDQSVIEIYHTPTLASSGEDGSALYGTGKLVAGGTGPQSGGGSGGREVELILDRGLKYLLRVTNISGNTKNVGVELRWYEHDPLT